jgi:surface antigen
MEMSAKKAGVVFFIFFMTVVGNAIARDTYDYDSSCPKNGGKMNVDKWNFYQCECTSYSTDKMNEHSVKMMNSYKNVHWGNASNWVTAAAAAKVSYNSSPKNRDIAWFSYGHVAYVESVDSKGNVTISEYNYNPKYDYNTRTIKKGSSSYPKYFIHFGAK